MLAKVAIAIKAIHRLRVLHCDPEARNIICDDSGSVRIVDFERSKIQLNRQEEGKGLSTKRKQYLGIVSPHQTRTQPPFRLDLPMVKTQGVENRERAEDVKNTDFVTGLRDLIQHIAYCYPRVCCD